MHVPAAGLGKRLFVAAPDKRCSDTEDDGIEYLKSELLTCQHSHVPFRVPQQCTFKSVDDNVQVAADRNNVAIVVGIAVIEEAQLPRAAQLPLAIGFQIA